MIYSEASYFEGYAFQHIAAFEEQKRLRRIAVRNAEVARDLDRRTGHRRCSR